MAASASRYAKPKKPKPGWIPNSFVKGSTTASQRAVTQPKPGAPVAVSPSTPATGKPAQAAAPAPPAQFGTFTPPVTGQGSRMRSTAESTYQAALRTGRQGIVDAALRLGSPEILAALRHDPNFAEYVGILDKGASDPSSQFAQSAQDEKQGLQDIDVNANAGNTYFSGKRLENRGNLTRDFNTARQGYLRDYTTGYNTLIGNMGTAKGQYERDLFDADKADYDAWLAAQPQPTGPDDTANPAATSTGIPEGFAGMPQVPGATGPPKGIFSTTPKQGYGFVQTEGSRAGMSYNVIMKNGNKYRKYENGDVVRVG